MRLRLFIVLNLLIASSVFASDRLPGKPATNVGTQATKIIRTPVLPKWAQSLAAIPDTKRSEPVVIRLAETQAIVGDRPAVLVNRALQVNDKSALGRIGQIGLDYFPAFQKFILHRVSIIRGGQVFDRMATVDTRLLQRETGIEGGVYGGATTVQLLLDDVRVGDTLWFTYTIEGENPVFGSRWSNKFNWDSGAPVEMRSLTILRPRAKPLYWRQLGDFNSEPIKPEVDTIGDLERLRFVGRGLEPLESESSIPSAFFVARVLNFSEYKDWQEVAQWANELFPKKPASPALKALAQQFMKEPTPSAKASAALHWVQSEIRYFSVSVGEDSHRPQAPETVLKRRYGDCKDVAYLLVSLLEQLGVEARPVLLSATAPKVPGKVNPSPTWFDHAIVQVTLDGKSYFVDPTRTGQKGPIEKFSASFPGAAALVVDPDSQSLVTLPVSAADFPLHEQIEHIALTTFDGDATLDMRQIYRESYAEWARQRFSTMSVAELKKAVLAQYEKEYPGITLLEAPRQLDDGIENRFELTARFKLSKPVIEMDDRYSINYSSKVIEGTLGIPDKVVRNYPLALASRNHRGRYRLSIEWPASIRSDDPPMAKEFDNPFFRARDEFILRGNYLDYLMDYEVKVGEVAAKDVPQLQRHAKELFPLISASFRVSKDAAVDSSIETVSFRELDVGRAAAMMIEVGESGKARNDKERSYDDETCSAIIAMAYFSDYTPDAEDTMGQTEQGLRHFASVPGASRCLARLLFAKGEFENSVEFYQAERIEDDSPHMRELAWARFYAGDVERAVNDMARYRSAREKKYHVGFDMASQIALLQRAGKTIPPALAQYASEIPDGPWPRPLLAMQAGAISEEALIKKAEELPADARALALGEAWFYIGQRRLARKDLAGAAAAFRWLLVDGIRGSGLVTWAKAELKRMEPTDENYRAGLQALSENDRATAFAKFSLSAVAGIAGAQRELGYIYYYGKGVKFDNDRALHWFQLAAQQKDPAALNMLGVMHALGKGVAADEEAAREWYRSAAQLGDPHAQYNLGFRYLHGNGVKQDHAMAFEYFRRAAEQGHVDAQAELANFYAEGDVVPQDYATAVAWNRRAVAQGNNEGQLQLGYLIEMGYGVEKDVIEANKLYQMAAERGNPAAQFNLASNYQAGNGMAKDDAKAVELFEKAAQSGHKGAQVELALRYTEGRGVRKDPEKARSLLTQATENGSRFAPYHLGRMYRDGQGGRADTVLAVKYFRKAAEGGVAAAQEALALLLHSGHDGIAANPDEAAEWYRKAADQGRRLSQNNLGDMYENGRGVPQDYARAISLYRQSARNRSGIAFLSLASLYDSGAGLPRDPVLAYTYVQIALKLESSYAGQIAVPPVSPSEKEAADRVAADWTPNMPLPGEIEMTESYAVAVEKAKTQAETEQFRAYDKEWKRFNNEHDLGQGDCISQATGPVNLVIIHDEMGVVREVAADVDNEKAACFKRAYWNVRFPVPPVPVFRMKLQMK